MVSFPKNVKYNKVHSYLPQSYDIECKKIKLLRGFIGLKTLQSGHISANQIEAFRRVVIRVLRKNKGSRLWICIFPFVSLTRKPNGVRMGKGKGEHSEWVSAVKRGKMLFELAGMSRKSAITVLLHAKTKLALKTSIVIND